MTSKTTTDKAFADTSVPEAVEDADREGSVPEAADREVVTVAVFRAETPDYTHPSVAALAASL